MGMNRVDDTETKLGKERKQATKREQQQQQHTEKCISQNHSTTPLHPVGTHKSRNRLLTILSLSEGKPKWSKMSDISGIVLWESSPRIERMASSLRPTDGKWMLNPVHPARCTSSSSSLLPHEGNAVMDQRLSVRFATMFHRVPSFRSQTPSGRIMQSTHGIYKHETMMSL